MRRRSWMILGALAAVAACSGSGGRSPAASIGEVATTSDVSTDRTATTVRSAPVDAVDGTLPLADEAMDDPEVTTVATDLAPSQIVASTVPRPPTPPECTGEQVELWTAGVVATGNTVDAVIRVRNSGGVWCEPDIGRSPLIDPNVEPDVWLEPGQTADLIVGQMETDCAEPALVTLIQVGILTDSLVVPSAVVTCGWWLTAFYPNDVIDEPCSADNLEAIALADAVVVRNTSRRGCVLGPLVDVVGAAIVEGESPEPLVSVLFPGDLAAWGSPSAADCGDTTGPVTLVGENFGAIDVPGVSCHLAFELAGARAWVGSRFGPTFGHTTGPLDVEALLSALDPFGDRT